MGCIVKGDVAAEGLFVEEYIFGIRGRFVCGCREA